MNVNILLLSQITGRPAIALEGEWRKAKKFCANDGQKGNYLMAWEWMLTAMADKRACLIPTRLKVGMQVIYGSIDGVIVKYDEEFCWLNRGQDVVGVPTVLLML